MNEGAWNSTLTFAVVVTFVVTFVPFGVTSVLVTIVGLFVPLSTPLETDEGVGLGLVISSAEIFVDSAATWPLAVFVIVVVCTIISGSTTIFVGGISGSGEVLW